VVRRRPVRAEGPGEQAAPAGWFRGRAAGPGRVPGAVRSDTRHGKRRPAPPQAAAGPNGLGTTPVRHRRSGRIPGGEYRRTAGIGARVATPLRPRTVIDIGLMDRRYERPRCGVSWLRRSHPQAGPPAKHSVIRHTSSRLRAFQPLRAPRCEPVRAGCSPGPPADLGELAASRVSAECGRSMRVGRSRRSGRAGRRSPAVPLRPGAPAVCR
jgi:hypothetical protein